MRSHTAVEKKLPSSPSPPAMSGLVQRCLGHPCPPGGYSPDAVFYDLTSIPAHGQGDERRPRTGTCMQPKLRVSSPHDAAERQADEIARKVVSTADRVVPVATRERPTQRNAAVMEFARLLCPDCEQELASQPEHEVVGLQRKASGSGPRDLPPAVEANIDSLTGGGAPLAESLRAYFEPRLGYDFTRVRVHTGQQASATANAIGASAYTIGEDIVFGEGKYAPSSAAGMRLLAHELVHVVQQKTAMDGGVPRQVFRHTTQYCDDEYERCCDRCRALPNRTKRDKARRALCWSSCMAGYAACLASSQEALTFAAIVAAIVLAAADGPFPIGDAAAAALLISLGIVGSGASSGEGASTGGTLGAEA